MLNAKQKRVRGVSVNPWGEVKKRFNISLTPSAIAVADELAKERGCSRSELIEELLRSLSVQKRLKTLEGESEPA